MASVSKKNFFRGGSAIPYENLFAYYRANGNSIDQVAGNNAVVGSNVSYEPMGTGQAWVFPSTSELATDRVLIPYTEDYAINDGNGGSKAYSFSCWLKMTRTGNIMSFVYQQLNPSNPIRIFAIGADNLMTLNTFTVGTNSRSCAYDVSGIPDDTWFHLVYTFSGATTGNIGAVTNLYINGINVVHNSTSGNDSTAAPTISTNDVALGGRYTGAFQYLHGGMKGAAWWNIEVTEESAVAIYNKQLTGELL